MNYEFLPKITGYCHRPRLSALFDRGMEHSLLTVVAGQGYGKTLSVADYMSRSALRCIWMRPLPQDNDIHRFWHHFVAAAQPELPNYAAQMEELGFPDTAARYDAFLRLFSQQVYSGARVAFVVDDYECIENRRILSFFSHLISSGIENLTLVLLSNQKVPFGSYNPDRGHFRISAEDLAFTAEETALLFEANGIAATPQQAARAAAETEGWPMALQLMCSGKATAAEALENRVPHHLAAELFEQCYYAGYPAAAKRTLLRLSLLPVFPLALLRAMAEPEPAPVMELVTHSPFIAYDHLTELFHLQKMYHSFLRRKCAVLPLEEQHETYLTAGNWFLENGLLYEAMDCFWACGSYERFLAAVDAMPRRQRAVSDTNGVLERLNSIPESYSTQNSWVDFARAFMLMNAMEMHQAQAVLHALRRRLEPMAQLPENKLLLGDIYLALGDASIFTGTDEGLHYFIKAAQVLPGSCRARGKDLLIVGNNDCFYLPTGAPGELERMVALFFEVAPSVDQVGGGGGHGFEYLFAAEAAYLTGRHDKAREHCFQAIHKARLEDQHDIICNSWWLLMRMACYYGNYPEAKKALDEITGYVDGYQLVDLHNLRDCAASWYHLFMGNSRRAASWIAHSEFAGQEMPLDLGRDRMIIAQYYFETGDAQRASAVLTQLDGLFKQHCLWTQQVLLHLIRAILHAGEGHPREALAAFERAYRMVYANNITALMVELGRGAMQLIDLVHKTGAQGYDDEWLEGVYRDAQSYAKRQLALRRAYAEDNKLRPPPRLQLTERELETLNYLAQGLTREEIAKLMDISVNAVKKHITKIYNRLGAVNRADAVHIASINGIINLIN